MSEMSSLLVSKISETQVFTSTGEATRRFLQESIRRDGGKHRAPGDGGALPLDRKRNDKTSSSCGDKKNQVASMG